MTKDGFQELNVRRLAAGQEAYVNARNSTAGTVRNLDPKNAAQAMLQHKKGNKQQLFDSINEHLAYHKVSGGLAGGGGWLGAQNAFRPSKITQGLHNTFQGL